MDVPSINTARHFNDDADSIACEIEQLLTDHDCFVETDDGETVLAAALLGRKGGRVKSEAKAAASRDNGKRGGRPPQAEPSVEASYQRERRKRQAEAIKKADQNSSSIAENNR